MAFQRGEIVLIPFPYTDLSTTKTRPTVVVSSSTYQANSHSELLLAFVSSQISQINPSLDYLLQDWKLAGLPKPSLVRPKLATINSSLIVHKVGKLSARDLLELDKRLRHAMALTQTALADVVDEVDLLVQPATLVQAIAEKAVIAAVKLAQKGIPQINLIRIKERLSPTDITL